MAIIRWSRGAQGVTRHAFLGFRGTSGLLQQYTSFPTEFLVGAAPGAAVVSADLSRIRGLVASAAGVAVLSAELTIGLGFPAATRPQNVFVVPVTTRVFVVPPEDRVFQVAA